VITSNVLVIPCFNEEHRLPLELVLSLADVQRVSVLLVNDGSSDGTASLISKLVAQGNGYVHQFDMPKNSGKAEAVRAGMNWAVQRKARRVGFTDADFATPPPEVLRLLDALESQGLGAVLGCRVARLGAHIERRTARHLVSRIFALLASECLRITVYDTQCGAKWFRVNSALEKAIAEPFTAKWAFDVELLGRLLGRWGNGPRLDDDDILEVPIRAWRDVGGSKVSLKGMLSALGDMVKMALWSRRLGAAHTDTLPKVPIEHPHVHPRTSWIPSSRVSVRAAGSIDVAIPEQIQISIPPYTGSIASFMAEDGESATSSNAMSRLKQAQQR
jgi:dolichyl-phosphate beta-glucosyltransferase